MLRYTQHDCIVVTYMKLPISLPNILTSVRIALIPSACRSILYTIRVSLPRGSRHFHARERD